MQIMTNTKDWYKANSNNPGTLPNGQPHSTQPGTNIYNSSTGSHPNFDSFFNNLYSLPGNKNKIWGHQICEESAFFNDHNYTNNPPDVSNGWPPLNFIETEVPLSNVLAALSYFRTKRDGLGLSNQKLVVMEANHSAGITNNLIYDGENNNSQSHYTAKHLLDQISNDVVFLEGSYMRFPTNWINSNYSNIFGQGPNTYHYLGFAKSIDFARTKTNTVHDVISSIINTPEYWNHFHSSQNIKNANYMWFQAYTSVIHGVNGIWFWDLNSSWESGEKPSNWSTNPARYERPNFSNLYKNYISHLTKELRYLVDKDIISTVENTIVATKTDFTDPNCIVPAAISYIPSYLPSEKRTENYGLRYTIRSNGIETYMIIANPLNVTVAVTLNFSNSSNQQIQSSTGVNVLFDNNQYSVTSSSYKVNRNSNINLTNGTVGSQYYVGYASNKQLPLSFGPMDVKVVKFVSTPPNYNNGWNIAWSNFGSGNINGHNVKYGDLFYIGDFDGDGSEELLCVGYTGGTNDWITVLKYVNDNWEWHWSNYGSSSAGNGIYPYRNNFIVGDFDGDGKDELLGNDINGWTTLFKFNNGNWQWTWSDNGNASHPIRPYKDKFYAGDFNGDGKDELFGCDLPNGWTTTFKWNGSNFIWDWSDYGSNHAIRQYRTKMLPGDFDGDGKVEMLGFDGWSTLFHFDNGNWQWGWSTYGANNFSGWTYPPLSTDQILSGNLDLDNKDELFFLQTDSPAAWATTMDLKNDQSGWNWNWSANPQYSVPFIDDWPLAANGGSNTRYYLVKAKSNEPKYLLAMRKFCGNYLVNMYKTISPSNYIMANVNIEDNFNSFKPDNDISVFPNPSDGKIQILSTKSDITYIEVLDARGQTIYNAKYSSQQKVEIDLAKYPTGIYILKLTDSQNSVSIRKIILNK